MTDVNGVRHILYLVVRGTTLTGVYYAPCDQPNAVAFVQDGVVNGAELRLTLLFQPDGVPAYRELVDASVKGDELHLAKRRQGWPNKSTTLQMVRAKKIPFPARTP